MEAGLPGDVAEVGQFELLESRGRIAKGFVCWMFGMNGTPDPVEPSLREPAGWLDALRSRVAARSAVLFAGDAGRRAVLALCGVVAFRALTLEQMGHLSLAISVATFLRFVCGGGAPFVLRRDYRRNSPHSAAIWSAALLLSGGSLALCFVIVPPLAWGFEGPVLALSLALVMAYHGAGAITDCYRSLHIAEGESIRAALVDVVPAAILLGLTLLVVVVGKASDSVLAAAYAAAGVGSVVVASSLAVNPPSFRVPPLSAFWSFTRQSFPFLLEGVIVNAYFRLSAVVLYARLGADSVALFTTGQAIGLLFGMLPLNVGNAAFPRIVAAARTSSSELRSVVRLLWLRTLVPGVVVVGLVVFLSPWWLPVVLGENAAGVVPHFVCFAISRLAVFVSAPAIYALDALRMQRTRVWVSSTLLGFVAVFAFPAMAAFGSVGMSLTLATAEFVSAALYVNLFLRASRPPIGVTGGL